MRPVACEVITINKKHALGFTEYCHPGVGTCFWTEKVDRRNLLNKLVVCQHTGRFVSRPHVKQRLCTASNAWQGPQFQHLPIIAVSIYESRSSFMNSRVVLAMSSYTRLTDAFPKCCGRLILTCLTASTRRSLT